MKIGDNQYCFYLFILMFIYFDLFSEIFWLCPSLSFLSTHSLSSVSVVSILLNMIPFPETSHRILEGSAGRPILGVDRVRLFKLH